MYLLGYLPSLYRINDKVFLQPDLKEYPLIHYVTTHKTIYGYYLNKWHNLLNKSYDLKVLVDNFINYNTVVSRNFFLNRFRVKTFPRHKRHINCELFYKSENRCKWLEWKYQIQANKKIGIIQNELTHKICKFP